MAIITTVFSVLLTRPLLELLQTPAEIIDDATAYLVIIFLGIPATILFNLLSNAVRALGDSKTPLYFLIFACCVNIVLDLVFILYLHLGVAGAGIATILSQLLSGILCIFFIIKKVPILRLKKADFQIHYEVIASHLSIALPMAFQMSIIAIGSLMLQFALNGLGAASVAAYTASQKIESIATMPLGSFGTAMATYAAQNYGAGKISRIRKGVFQCILMSGSFSILSGAINVVAGSQLTSIFVGSQETEVLLSGNQRMFLLCSGIIIYLSFYASGVRKKFYTDCCRCYGADYACHRSTCFDRRFWLCWRLCF